MAKVQVFKTAPGSEESTQIAGVGLAGADGKGGIVIEDAAKAMPELQERDEDGTLILDEHEQPTPLTGKKLKDAAEQFADDRGLVVVSVEESAVAKFADELGRPAEGISARDKAVQEYEDSGLADLEPDNTPEEMTGEPEPVAQTGEAEGEGS